MKFKLPSMLDPFLLLLLGTVATASILPCRGEGAVVFGWITNAAITLLFFLHGAKLSREAVLAGVGHWRLHLLVAASTYILFPVLGLAIRFLGRGWVDPNNHLLDGILFLCLLPSTVQSSIAFTSIARGNVPAAVCSATLSNVAGVFITPVLVGLTLGAVSKGGHNGIDLKSIESIGLQLLLPFIAGHLSRPLTSAFLTRYKSIVGKMLRSGRANLFKSDPEAPDSSVTLESVVDQLVIWGTPEKVADDLLAFREETGPFGTLLYAGHDWADRNLAIRSMELMAEQVVPAVNRA